MAVDFNAKEYGDVHRFFVQAIMSKGLFGTTEVFDTFTAILKECGIRVNTADRNRFKQQLQELVLTINRGLRTMGFEIRRSMDERTGYNYYVLVNRMAGAHMIAAFKHYSENQLEFFKAVVAKIFDDDNREVNIMNALNLARHLPKRMNMNDAEAFMDRLIADKWFLKVNENLRLTVRAISEMEPYLKNTYQLKDCKICNNVITLNKCTECASCQTNAHFACVSKQPRKNCPKEDCRTTWPLDDPSVESQSSNSTSQQSNENAQQASTSQRRSNSFRRVQPMEEDDDES